MKTACPKCETKLREDALRCPVCGTPQSLSGFRPDPDRKPDPVLDPMLPLFEREERILVCAECFAEFRSDQKRCRPCQAPLVRWSETDYCTRLAARPIQDLGAILAEGPPPVPNDLVRIHIAKSLSELTAVLKELAFVGLEPWAGSDALDPFDRPAECGVYVRRPDVEAATFFVSAFKPKDPLDLAPREAVRPLDAKETAEEWIRFGKYKEAARVLERAGESGPTLLLKVDATLRSGRIKAALKLAEESARGLALEPLSKGRLLGRAGVIAALGADGSPFGRGADLAHAEALLREASPLAPRALEISKALIEVLNRLGKTKELLAVFERAQTICPNLLSRQNPFRSVRDRLLYGIEDAWPFPR